MNGIKRIAAFGMIISTVWLWAAGSCVYAGDESSGDPKNPTNQAALLGYWPLSQDVEGKTGSLRLIASQSPLKFVSGPLLGEDRGLDLRSGQYLKIAPTDCLDVSTISIELFCKIQEGVYGCLFGVRNRGDTRFSLHYIANSPMLTLWDERCQRKFTAPAPLLTGKWYHLALSLSACDAKLWVDGQACGSTGNATMNEKATGLPFVVGTSDADMGEVERADIAVAGLALYRGILTKEAITDRLKAMDWFEKMSEHQASPSMEGKELDAMVADIKQKYGVDVFYKYNPEQFIPAVWKATMVGVQIDLPHAKVHLEEIQKFLKRVPLPVLEKNLKAIYLFKSLSNGGHGMGGMAYKKAIYLCYGGPSHARNALFHEFTHILQFQYPPDVDAWKKDLPEDFKYLGNEANRDAYHADDKMHSLGFVLKYGMMSLNEEMAVLSDYVFTRPQKTRALMRKYPSIRRRVARLMDYYKSVSPDYDFSEYKVMGNGDERDRR